MDRKEAAFSAYKMVQSGSAFLMFITGAYICTSFKVRVVRWLGGVVGGVGAVFVRFDGVLNDDIVVVWDDDGVVWFCVVLCRIAWCGVVWCS